MLATANRSRVSIRLTKNFDQSRERGRSGKSFPRISFDHYAKFGCCFSYCVHAGRTSQTLGCWGPASWDGSSRCGQAKPVQIRPSPSVSNCQIWSFKVNWYERNCGDPPENFELLRSAFQDHSRSSIPTRIDRLPATSY